MQNVHPSPSERDCIAAAQRGDADATSTLWDSYTPKLYGYLIRVLRDRDTADDLLQRTWMNAIASLPRFQPRASFGAYLFAIAKNECHQHWRKSGREVALENAEQLPAAPNATHDVLEVERILAHLSEDDRELLRLRYIADLAVQDIARVLDISTTATSVRLHRALKRARQITRISDDTAYHPSLPHPPSLRFAPPPLTPPRADAKGRTARGRGEGGDQEHL